MTFRPLPGHDAYAAQPLAAAARPVCFISICEDIMTWAFFARASVFAAAFFALAGLSPAHALNVQPLALDMVAIGANSRGTIQIVNDSAKPLPVDVSFKKLDIGPDGKTTELPAKDEFLIFPPQAVVPPGATQSFRIQWAGAPDIKKSETYMVSVNQLPIKMKPGESGVQMVFTFGVIVNVAPVGGQSALKVLRRKARATTRRRASPSRSRIRARCTPISATRS